MGQQQLLLIILGVIIVGIAVAVGINMFTASASAANRDAVTSDLANLASMAQQFYRRPAAMGGGNNTFTGWTLPSQLDTTANGIYSLDTSSGSQTVVIIGVGTEPGNDPAYTNTSGGPGLVEVHTTVTSTTIATVVSN